MNQDMSDIPVTSCLSLQSYIHEEDKFLKNYVLPG